MDKPESAIFFATAPDRYLFSNVGYEEERERKEKCILKTEQKEQRLEKRRETVYPAILQLSHIAM